MIPTFQRITDSGKTKSLSESRSTRNVLVFVRFVLSGFVRCMCIDRLGVACCGGGAWCAVCLLSCLCCLFSGVLGVEKPFELQQQLLLLLLLLLL